MTNGLATDPEASTGRWRDYLTGDPLPWLLEANNPAVRAATLKRLLGRPDDHADVVAARHEAMRVDPIAAILDAQHPDGWWGNPGPGYGPKYSSTVWQLIILDQLGVDPTDAKVQKGCAYVLKWTTAESGGFGARGGFRVRKPPQSTVYHCLNGNLLHALISFGHLDHPEVQAAIGWAAQTISGGDSSAFYDAGTSRPGFECAANEHYACAWGAIKELRGLALIPVERRTPAVSKAIETGVALLLSRDPAAADYPMGYGNTKPSRLWFKLGFPSCYAADVLQTLEVLASLGYAGDPRLDRAYEFVQSKQDGEGRWLNRYAYNGKTTVDIERQSEPSKWVTLRACSALKARYG